MPSSHTHTDSQSILEKTARFAQFFKIHFPDIRPKDFQRQHRFDVKAGELSRKELLAQCVYLLEIEIPEHVENGYALLAIETLGRVEGVLVATGCSIAEVDAIGLPTSLTA